MTDAAWDDAQSEFFEDGVRGTYSGGPEEIRRLVEEEQAEQICSSIPTASVLERRARFQSYVARAMVGLVVLCAGGAMRQLGNHPGADEMTAMAAGVTPAPVAAAPGVPVSATPTLDQPSRPVEMAAVAPAVPAAAPAPEPVVEPMIPVVPPSAAISVSATAKLAAPARVSTPRPHNKLNRAVRNRPQAAVATRRFTAPRRVAVPASRKFSSNDRPAALSAPPTASFADL